MSHPLSLNYIFDRMDALGREAQYLQANGRKCSCGYPQGPCLRSQTDCIAIQPDASSTVDRTAKP